MLLPPEQTSKLYRMTWKAYSIERQQMIQAQQQTDWKRYCWDSKDRLSSS